MKYTWFMFLVLTVAGGLIAFMGDRLGRYMGKRRMSVFGLRPRHTALCFTVVAGMLIALTSLGVMSSVSKHVRIALFQVDDLEWMRDRATLQRDTATRQRDTLRQKNRLLSRETNHLRADYERAKQRVHAAAVEERRSRERLDRTLASLSQTRAEAERRIAGLRREVVERTRLAAAKSRQIGWLGTKLAGVKGKLATTSEQLAEAEEGYRLAQARRQSAAAQYEVISARQVRTEEDLAKAQVHLGKLLDDVRVKTQQVKAAEVRAAELEQARAELEKQRDGLQTEIAALKTEQADLKSAVRLARQNEDDARNWVVAQRTSSLICVRGQELAWEVIDGREPPARVRERLLAMVERARSAASSQGAGTKDASGTALVPVRVLEQAGGSPLEVLSGAKAVAAATDEIRRANTSVVVQLKAATNTVVGDPVVSEIQIWINRLVFHEGDPVARKLVNGRQPVGEIVQELVALLHGEVRTTALARGMIPRPSATEGLATAVQVGEVLLADVVATAERIRKQRSGATVEVVAATDLWAADSMKVAFRVGPRASQPGQRGSGGILTGR